MKFHKMNGAGNDFIIVNNLDGAYSSRNWPKIAKHLCKRRLSVGADGFMVVEPAADGGDFRMRFYNADGSEGEMCGNGARCICRYGYEMSLAGEIQKVETAAGLVTGERISKRMYRVKLNNPGILKPDYPITVEGTQYMCSYVELGQPGVPHAIVPISDLKNFPSGELLELGRSIRHHKAFPKGVNVNFYEITGPNQVYERTFERGVEDFTYACGTGTASMAAVLTLQGKSSGHSVRVTMPGGELIVDVECEGKEITGLYLTGPTNMVANGEITDEDLIL